MKLQICLVAGACLLADACAVQAKETETVTLTVPVIFESQIPEDIPAIEAAANEITLSAIGAELNLVPVLRPVTSDSRRSAEITLLENGDEPFDLLHESLGSENLLPLKSLLREEGGDILELFGENGLDLLEEEELYYIPSISDYVSGQGIAMRKDIVDKYGIDLENIQSYEDLDAVFSEIAPLEPQMKMISSFFTQRSLFYHYYMDIVENTVFAVTEETGGKAVSIYETDEYRETVSLFHDWYEKGYTFEYAALQNLSAYQLVESGELFSYVCAYKPGIEYEASSNCKTPMVVVKTMDPVLTDRTLSMSGWGISGDCEHPQKAMELLNLLYTDADLANLLTYGIEGVNYRVLEDGSIDWPEGENKESAGYYNDAAWILPNQFLTYIWKGEDPDLWEQLDAYNRSAARSLTFGFAFDDSTVKTENDALNEIALRYDYGLGTGQLDPGIYLDRMQAEMEEAGLETVRQEIDRQYQSWKAKQKDG